MLEGRELVPGRGKIDRRVDADGVERVELGARQVEVEMRMLLADLGRVVAHAVVALRKDRDAVDVSILERLGEGLGVELRTDPGDRRVGVEIEMDLTKTHMYPLV